MSGQAVEPLRINKGGSVPSSPAKMDSLRKNRPLSEINPMERRRNSPSFPQIRESQKPPRNRESSPFDSSPFNPSSPRIFWNSHEGNSPTRLGPKSPPIPLDHSPSTTRRSSIENLKKASRVKNSNMFAREHKNEYDPASTPQVERPLAAGRPFKTVMKENSFDQPANDVPADFRLHRPSKSMSQIPLFSPNKSSGRISASGLRTDQQTHEQESSLMSDHTDSELQPMPTPRARVRHAKSVTFDTEAPVINEYEEQTPEPSSIASGSRASSYDIDEESEEDYSFDRGSSVDQEDSFDESLEDTDKTPVVLPEDWRHMSPLAARTELVEPGDDVFDSKDESPLASPSKLQRPSNLLRSDSSNSEESRPLPPVPNPFSKGRRDSGGLSGTADRMSSFQRSLPTPPRPASVSKADILGMRDGSLTLDDRFRLMELKERDQSNGDQSPVMEQTEDQSNVADAGKKPHDSRTSDVGVPRISRESILRKVKSRDFHNSFGYSSPVGSECGSPERSYGDLDDLDPDVPIPSREASSNFDEQVPDAPIKKEPSDSESEVDVYAIPDMYSEPPEERPDQAGDYARESSVLHHKITSEAEDDDQDGSRYSNDAAPEKQDEASRISEEDGPPTPTQEEFHKFQTTEDADNNETSEVMDMSEFESYLNHQSFEDRVKTFMGSSLSPDAEHDSSRHAQTLAANLEYLKRNITPEEDEAPTEESNPPNPAEEDRSDTPDSVVHHAVAVESEPQEVPEPIATIKSSGGSKLKTRHSATPADMEVLAAYRRQVSGEKPPPIPTRNEKRLSQLCKFDWQDGRTGSAGSDGTQVSHQSGEDVGNASGMLDIAVGGFSDDLGLGLKQEFDRVIESQKVAYSDSLQQISPISTTAENSTSNPTFSYPNKTTAEYIGSQPFCPQRNPTHKLTRSQKGYLMRQNTKVVVASSRQFSDEKKNPPIQPRTSTEEAHAPPPNTRGTRSAGNSPRKASQNKAWATEPWNGKIRRKSLRVNSGNQKKAALAAAPPLPGQESAIGKADLGTEQALTEETEEGIERGRLFVKVVGVKDLDLPLPRSERTQFQLTLDNGLHCVTTSWLELGHAAPIGQEFELVVLNDLEFQLTLQTKLEPPTTSAPTSLAPSSPSKSIKPQKSSTFSRFLSSPKKRREAEQRAAEEAEAARKQEIEDQRRTASQKEPSAWELLHDLVAQDGSFARAYVSLSNHVGQCYGRPFTVAVPCFNEWALETDPMITSSVRSKQRGMGIGGVVRRPPYKVGKLELQLLYVPRVRGTSEEDMPRSLGAAVRELREAEREDGRKWEGFLSQQGGDCPFWRRRFFKLSASKLTAFHEYTNQPRATINLAKAASLIDDKSSLIQPVISPSSNIPTSSPLKGSTSPSKSKRRKSGFAEDEDGYMFVEEGFRIRFANGEVIDFYADNAQDKQGWMRVLSEIVGKGEQQVNAGTGDVKKWCQIVLAKEKSQGRKGVEETRLGSGGSVNDNAVSEQSQAQARTNSIQRKQLPPNPPQPTPAMPSRLSPQPQPQPQQIGPAGHSHPQVQSNHARTKSVPNSPVKQTPQLRPHSSLDPLPIPHMQPSSSTRSHAAQQAQAQAQAAHYQHREREREREQIRARQAAMQAASPTKGTPVSGKATPGRMRVGGRFGGAKRDGVRSMIF